MMFLASALMYSVCWICTTILMIHFNNPWYILCGILISIVLPTFKQEKTEENHNTKDVAKGPPSMGPTVSETRWTAN